VPAARHSDEPRTVRIDVQSRTLAAVLGALVQAEGWHMHGSGASEKNVDAVIYAADDPSEVETILRMRARFPSARIIAAGAPSHPEIFDAVCPLPVNRAALVRALEANRTTGWAVS